MTRQAVSNWERNVTLPDRPTIERLSAILGASLDQLARKEKTEKKINKGDIHMPKKELETETWSINKYDTAIGIFYAASVFIGAMAAIILLLLNKPTTWVSWAIPIVIGLLVFLILGLIMHGIITLVRKD